jgi:hypothetical protein
MSTASSSTSKYPAELKNFAVPHSTALSENPHLTSISVATVIYNVHNQIFYRPEVLVLRVSRPRPRGITYSGKWTIPIATVEETDATILDAVSRLIVESTGFTGTNIVGFAGYFDESEATGRTTRTYTFHVEIPRENIHIHNPTVGAGYRFGAWFGQLRASDNWANYPSRAVGMFVNEFYADIDHVLNSRCKFRVRNYKDDKDVNN